MQKNKDLHSFFNILSRKNSNIVRHLSRQNSNADQSILAQKFKQVIFYIFFPIICTVHKISVCNKNQ